jgi:hypothetical protein
LRRSGAGGCFHLIEFVIKFGAASVGDGDTILAPSLPVSSSRDSGVIDLFAIHEEALRAQSQPPPPSSPLSAPPVALDMASPDASMEIDDFDPAVFGRPKGRGKWIAAGAGALAFFGIVIALATSGSDEPEPVAAAAAVAAPPPVEHVPEPPPPAAAPPPVAEASPEPAPPATSREAAQAPPRKATKGKARKAKRRAPKRGGGGVKLEKIQSSGL